MKLPQEIVDHIIDYFHCSYDTLRLLCLVSKSWVDASRHHLLWSVSLVSFDSVETFAQILNESVAFSRNRCLLPLGHYVRELRAGGEDVDTFWGFLDIQKFVIMMQMLPNLDFLSIYRAQFFSDYPFDSTLQSSLTLEELHLIGVRFETLWGDEWSPTAAFLRCFSAIEGIEIDNPSFYRLGGWMLPSAEKLTGPAVKVKKILFPSHSDINALHTFPIIRRATDLTSVDSLFFSPNLRHEQYRSIGQFMRSCSNCRGIVLNLCQRHTRTGQFPDWAALNISHPTVRKITLSAVVHENPKPPVTGSNEWFTEPPAHCDASIVTAKSWGPVAGILSTITDEACSLQGLDILLLVDNNSAEHLPDVVKSLDWASLRDSIRKIPHAKQLQRVKIDIEWLQMSSQAVDGNIGQDIEKCRKSVQEVFSIGDIRVDFSILGH